MYRKKEKLPDSPGNNIKEFYNLLAQGRFATSQKKFISDRTNLKLPNDLSFQVLENYEILQKTQIWVEGHIGGLSIEGSGGRMGGV